MHPAVQVGFTLYQGQPDKLAADIERASRLGADLVELSLSPLECVIGGRVNKVRTTEVRHDLAHFAGAVTIHAPLSLSLMDIDHADIQWRTALACLDVCQSLNAELMVIHPGWVSPDRFAADQEGMIKYERDRLHRLAEEGEARGITLALENMPIAREFCIGQVTTYGLDPEAVAKQIRAVGHSHLRATIDFSHAYLTCRYFGWDLLDRLKALAPLATHLHFHDSFGLSPTTWENLFPGEESIFGEGDLHLPLGWGDLPYDHVIPALPLENVRTATLETGMSWRTEAVAADSLSRARALCDLRG